MVTEKVVTKRELKDSVAYEGTAAPSFNSPSRLTVGRMV
jgi:hypothetical protein